MKIFFLLNPTRVKNRWDWREPAAREAKRAGCIPRFGEVDRFQPHSTERLLDQALEEGCSRVVVVGGDGSLHRAINHLAHRQELSKIEIGIVPAGTCNDFARFLGQRRKRVEDAFRLACSGKATPFDLALMDKEYFINNAGFGRRPDPPGRRKRPLQTLRSFRPLHLKARWDKGAIEGLFYMGLVCNAPYFSGGLHFSKESNLRDGLLDVYLIPAMSKWKLLPILALGRMGRPVKSKRLISLKVSQISFETDQDIWPQADGEPPASARRQIRFSVSTEKAMIVSP